MSHAITTRVRTLSRRTYLALYVLVTIYATWALFAPPSPVELWAGRPAVMLWTAIVVTGALVGGIAAWAGWILIERVGSVLLAVGLWLYALAVVVFDHGEGIRAMQAVVSILAGVVFVPIRWFFHPEGYRNDPRPERIGRGVR